MIKKDTKKIEKLINEAINGQYDQEDDYQEDDGLIGRAFSLAKDYYTIEDDKYKKMIKQEIQSIIRHLDSFEDEHGYTSDIVGQIRSIMVHGSPDQDEYNAENAFERSRETYNRHDDY
jgi:hypothetical protein